MFFFFFSSRRRHTRFSRDWSSDVCSSDLASLVATRIRSPLLPHHVPEAPVRDEIRRVAREFADGITLLARTPRALGPITSITLDQVGQGIVLVLSLFVFRHRFGEGVGSFSNLIRS